MRVAILYDWFDTLRTLPCFERLDGHDVTVFTDHVQETDALAERLQGFVCLGKSRTCTRHARSCPYPVPLEYGRRSCGALLSADLRPIEFWKPTLSKRLLS